MKESKIIDYMVEQIEKETGMICKVVPDSNTWHDGYCLDTSKVSLLMSMGGLKDYMKGVRKRIQENSRNDQGKMKVVIEPKGEFDSTTITLINNGFHRNINRLRDIFQLEETH